MPNIQLPDFITAENELDGNEPVYIAQGGKTRKTTLQKIKDFIIGTAALLTVDKTPTGAINELKQGIDNNTQSIIDNTSSLSEKANQSTKDINLYVSLTGNDANDGLTSTTPFKTIQHAIDVIPNFLKHDVTINVSSGTYNEDVNVSNVYGGTIYLNGGSNLTESTSFIINSINLSRVSRFHINGFTFNNTINISLSQATTISYCRIISVVSYGIRANYSNVGITECIISDASIAIFGYFASNIYLVGDIGGTNNTIVYSARNCSIIYKSSTSTINGVTLEQTIGGIIL